MLCYIMILNKVIEINTNRIQDNYFNNVSSIEYSNLHQYNSTKLDEEADYNNGIDSLIKRGPLYIVIPLTVLYSIILILGVTGNIINCLVIMRIKYMHTTTNYYLFSLSVSDLLLLTTGLPLEIYYAWSRYPYIFGETFCILRGLMAETSTNATVLTITAFSIERYIAICHPFQAYSMSKLSRAVKLILSIWLIAFICAIPQALQFGLVPLADQWSSEPEYSAEHTYPAPTDTEYPTICTMKRTIIPHSFELSTLFFFVIPMIIITILYILIGIKLKNSNKLKQRLVRKSFYNYSISSANTSRNSMFSNNAPQPSKKILKMLVAVVVTFFICWAPFHAQRIIAIYVMNAESDNSSITYDVATYISAIFYYTASMMNPFLYQLTSNKFRGAFKVLLGSRKL